MPAINPARLKHQTTLLVERISDPQNFVTELQDILDFYADRTKRPGRGEKRFSLARSYNVSRQVLRQIKASLRPVILSDPESALYLIDLLWDQNWVECRTLALDILGWLPTISPDEIIDRINRWAAECANDVRLAESLADLLLLTWQHHPQFVLDQFGAWALASDLKLKKVSFIVISYFIDSPSFNNVPAIFKIIAPLLDKESSRSDGGFINVLRALARCSPQETAYFLKQHVLITNDPNPEVVIRQCIDSFPEYDQIALRSFLRQRREDFQDR